MGKTLALGISKEIPAGTLLTRGCNSLYQSSNNSTFSLSAFPTEAQQKRAPQGSVFPHLSGPELPSLQLVLQIVTDDVSFLQEEAHGVGQLRVLPDDRIFQL